MRTEQEILDKINETKNKDFFGVMTSHLVFKLPYDLAKPFLNDEANYENYVQESNTKEFTLSEMREYMSFAWDKANSCKGLSASRSMDHFTAWIWLLGDEDKFPNLQTYNYYGKDHLVKICNYYGFINEDDGIREN